MTWCMVETEKRWNQLLETHQSFLSSEALETLISKRLLGFPASDQPRFNVPICG